MALLKPPCVCLIDSAPLCAQTSLPSDWQHTVCRQSWHLLEAEQMWNLGKKLYEIWVTGT